MVRTGIGYDVHRLVANRPLILGGVTIPFHKGLLGHSDADVLSHAVADAILGAAALGDIGVHFPDDDPKWQDVSGIRILQHVKSMLHERGYKVVNIDAVIIAEKPKILPFISSIVENLSKALDIETSAVSVKATTTEGLGFIGDEKGIATQAIAAIIETKKMG